MVHPICYNRRRLLFENFKLFMLYKSWQSTNSKLQKHILQPLISQRRGHNWIGGPKFLKHKWFFFKSVGCKVVPRPRATSGCLQVTSPHFQKGLFVSDGGQWFRPWNVLAQRGLRKKSSCIWKATYVSPSYETIEILHLLFKSGMYLMPIKLHSNQGLVGIFLFYLILSRFWGWGVKTIKVERIN
jgi:hypothetical protein